MKIDLTRCKECRKRPRGKLNEKNFERYDPFCSYHCKETHRRFRHIDYDARVTR